MAAHAVGTNLRKGKIIGKNIEQGKEAEKEL